MQSSWLKLGKTHRLYQLLVGLLPSIRSNWLALTVLIRILTMILRINTRHQNGSIITCCSSCRLGRYGSGDAVWLSIFPSAFMLIINPEAEISLGVDVVYDHRRFAWRITLFSEAVFYRRRRAAISSPPRPSTASELGSGIAGFPPSLTTVKRIYSKPTPAVDPESTPGSKPVFPTRISSPAAISKGVQRSTEINHCPDAGALLR